MTRTTRLLAGLSLLVVLPGLAAAATVYRWVDDDGKVHYSEVVPERFLKTAKPIDVQSGRPTADQQRDALERAGKDKAKAADLAASRAKPAPSAPAASAASTGITKHPARIPDERTDCATWQRLYQESIDCFGPFRTVRGGIKPEAFNFCNVVPEPPPERCRMRIP